MTTRRLLLLLGILAVLFVTAFAACEPETVPDCVESHEPDSMDDMDDKEEHDKFCMNITNALDMTTGVKSCGTDKLDCDDASGKKDLAANMTKLIDSTYTSLEAQHKACFPDKYGCNHTELSECYHNVFIAMDADLPDSMEGFKDSFDLFMKNLTVFCSDSVKAEIDTSVECAKTVYPKLEEKCNEIFSGVMDKEKVPNMTKPPKPHMGIVGEKLNEFQPDFFKNMSTLVCEPGCSDLSERRTKLDECLEKEHKDKAMDELIREIIDEDMEKHSVKDLCGEHKRRMDCHKTADEGCSAFKMWTEAKAMHLQDVDKAVKICMDQTDQPTGHANLLAPAIGTLVLAAVAAVHL